MPELPEVEAARRQLQRWTVGRRLDAVSVLDPGVVRSRLSSRPSDRLEGGADRLEALVGRRSEAVWRHGKRLGWVFGSEGLLTHFGMTGLFVLSGVDAPAPPLARVGLTFGDHTVWFVDGRRFGCVVPMAVEELELALPAGQGPDAVDAPLDGPHLAAALGARRPLKVALMDQERIAGLGNIHAAEACFRAGVNPFRSTGELTGAEWKRLAAAIGRQLRQATDDMGATDEVHYVNLGGPNVFQVYGRADTPCPACGAPICSAEQAGRTTFWCSVCQPRDGVRRAR